MNRKLLASFLILLAVALLAKVYTDTRDGEKERMLETYLYNG